MDTARLYSRISRCFLLAGVTLLGYLPVAIGAASTPAAETVVFVCEHGSAKSVIAAEQFNQQAARRGLPYGAISRGISPDAELQAATKLGMQRDGLDTSHYVASALSPEVAASALRVVTLGVANVPEYLNRERLRSWDDVPAVSKSYEGARDDLRRRMDALLDELRGTGQ